MQHNIKQKIFCDSGSQVRGQPDTPETTPRVLLTDANAGMLLGMNRDQELRLYTVGYEGRSVDEFVSVLTSAGVEVLVDVRERALSRKKGFSKRSLGETLRLAGIEYRHEPLLGDPKENREPFRQGEPEARDRYLAHLNDGSRSAFDAVVELAGESNVALMCFERAHDSCHRSCVSDMAVSEQREMSVVQL